MIRAIIFDCFGVLVGKGFDETYRSAGGDPRIDHDIITSLLGRTNLGLMSETQFHQEIAVQLGITLSGWRKAVRQSEQPDIELLEYIEQLRKKFKTAVLSNANRGVVQHKIGKHWLKRCFDSVVVSAEVGRVKPDPAIYQYAADSLGVQVAECVFFDDMERYARAADQAGMHGIVYQNLAQAQAELRLLSAT